MLILDTKTRWNSLIFMLELFLELKDCIKRAVIDLNLTINITDDEFTAICSIISILLPVKLAVEAICRSDANLITADTTINFMIQSLRKYDNILSNRFQTALLFEIEQRRTELSDIILYLHMGSQAFEETENFNFEAKHIFAKK